MEYLWGVLYNMVQRVFAIKFNFDLKEKNIVEIVIQEHNMKVSGR